MRPFRLTSFLKRPGLLCALLSLGAGLSITSALELRSCQWGCYHLRGGQSWSGFRYYRRSRFERIESHIDNNPVYSKHLQKHRCIYIGVPRTLLDGGMQQAAVPRETGPRRRMKCAYPKEESHGNDEIALRCSCASIQPHRRHVGLKRSPYRQEPPT